MLAMYRSESFVNDQMIKVVHISTAISHSSAPLRIHHAVRKSGISSEILTLRSSADNEKIEIFNLPFNYKIKNKLLSFCEGQVLKRYNRGDLPFSFGAVGVDLSKNRFIKNADIIHMHWINGQFLSFRSVAKLISLGKPIVWTFHDSWPMTGGCHVRYGCDKFQYECGNCPELHSDLENDVTRKIIKLKKKYYHIANIVTVSPSKWMYENVQKSSLFSQGVNTQIANPLDLKIFSMKNCENIFDKKEKITLLFGASGALELEYKGFRYFTQAMQYLSIKYKELAQKIEINIFGTLNSNFVGLENYRCNGLGYIHSDSDMAEVYKNADIYVFPSLDDNLPGTVMESLACGTPVVAFETGGVPEMVQHKENGYIAQYKDYADLADGIAWVMENNGGNRLGCNARARIEEKYEVKIIGDLYKQLYEDIRSKWISR